MSVSQKLFPGLKKKNRHKYLLNGLDGVCQENDNALREDYNFSL